MVGDADLGADPVVVLRGGNDRVILSGAIATGSVTICGDGGKDYLVALEDSRADSYVIDGGPGPDRMGDNSNVDNSGVGSMGLYGGSGDDVMIGTDFGDRLAAGDGDDLMLSVDGRDRMTGGDGEDSLFSKGGDDRAIGGGGDDRIELGGGTDYADGGPDVDTCKGAERSVNCEG